MAPVKIICLVSLSTALDGSGWSTPHTGHFIPEKESRHTLYRKLSMSQGRFGGKITPLHGLDTDWHIKLTNFSQCIFLS